MSQTPQKILIIFGTRPEAIKLSPHEFFFGLANCDLQMTTKEVAA